MIRDRLGRPLDTLRISLTDRCNFRCAYCMPASGGPYHFLRRAELLTDAEFVRLTRVLVGLGVRKIRLTGGEPLLRPEVAEIVAGLAALDGVHDLAMTTNGYLLARKARALKDAGLDRVNVSLDSLDNATFRQLNGNRSDVSQVLAGLSAAREAGLAPIKVNAVVKRGVNDDGILELAAFCREQGYTLRFIEFMDAGSSNGWRYEHVVTAEEIIARIADWQPLEPLDHAPDSVSLMYRYQDGRGAVGVIASVSRPFCRGCSRLRLSAEGKLYTCLFGVDGLDLRTPLRAGASDAEISAMIAALWQRRADRYSELRASASADTPRRVEMYHIGG
ncbi:MAG: GTP 3',8-cyclase MoaA [Anaerolineae bacterium]